jgi:hypothetical protein
MEFAALPDEPDQNDDESEAVLEREEEALRRPSVFTSRLFIPLGLLLLVVVAGVSAYAIARHSSKNSTAASSVAVSHEAMPPIEKPANEDSPFAILSQLQQGGGADSILGIGSTIKSFLYWTTVISVLFLASSIVMLIWMAKDSRNRGMESIATWIMPILLTNILAFLVYFFSRPRGQLANCRHCNNRCLENALTCPHCRRPKPTRKKRPRNDE